MQGFFSFCFVVVVVVMVVFFIGGVFVYFVFLLLIKLAKLLVPQERVAIENPELKPPDAEVFGLQNEGQELDKSFQIDNWFTQETQSPDLICDEAVRTLFLAAQSRLS